MRRLNLRIIEDGEEYQLRGTVNIFNKIVEENFPTLKNEMTTSIKEAFRTPNRLEQKRITSRHVIVKTPSAQGKERILKAVREKVQVTYKGRPIRITPDFSTETMKARRAWTRAQVPAQAAIPSKTINHHRWRDEDILRQIKIYTISDHKPSTTMKYRWKTNTTRENTNKNKKTPKQENQKKKKTQT